MSDMSTPHSSLYPLACCPPASVVIPVAFPFSSFSPLHRFVHLPPHSSTAFYPAPSHTNRLPLASVYHLRSYPSISLLVCLPSPVLPVSHTAFVVVICLLPFSQHVPTTSTYYASPTHQHRTFLSPPTPARSSNGPSS